MGVKEVRITKIGEVFVARWGDPDDKPLNGLSVVGTTAVEAEVGLLTTISNIKRMQVAISPALHMDWRGRLVLTEEEGVDEK